VNSEQETKPWLILTGQEITVIVLVAGINPVGMGGAAPSTALLIPGYSAGLALGLWLQTAG
jgi:hypothetical protein